MVPYLFVFVPLCIKPKPKGMQGTFAYLCDQNLLKTFFVNYIFLVKKDKKRWLTRKGGPVNKSFP